VRVVDRIDGPRFARDWIDAVTAAGPAAVHVG
jgi:hypothetical protein